MQYLMIAHETIINVTLWPLYCVQLSQTAHKNDDQKLSKQAVTKLMLDNSSVSLPKLRYKGSLIQNGAVAIVAEPAPINWRLMYLSVPWFGHVARLHDLQPSSYLLKYLLFTCNPLQEHLSTNLTYVNWTPKQIKMTKPVLFLLVSLAHSDWSVDF